MKQSRAAIRYAKATYSLSLDNNLSEKVYNDMLVFIEASECDNTFNEVLHSSALDKKNKKNIILSLNPNICKISKDLINLIIDNKRLSILIDIANSFKDLYEKENNMTKAIVITALPISTEIKSIVLEKIKSISNKKVEIKNIIDASILGGFILRFEDKEYDASMISKLKKLKKELV